MAAHGILPLQQLGGDRGNLATNEARSRLRVLITFSHRCVHVDRKAAHGFRDHDPIIALRRLRRSP